MDNKKCQCNACHCSGSEVQANGYCSDSCKQGKTNGGKCACGHPSCK